MKKIVFVILLLSIAVLSAASCGKNDDKVSGGDTVVENNDSSSAEKEGGEEAVYTDGMIIEAYIPFAALYFHDGFNSDDNVVSEKDVFHLTAQFIYTQRSDLISKISPDGTEFCVRGSDIENVARALFGADVSLEDISKYMNGELGDSYDGERGIYTFSTDIVNYSPDGYTVFYDEEMDIKEEGKTITATATVVDGEQNGSRITYTFEKTVFDGYMFAKLTSVEK